MDRGLPRRGTLGRSLGVAVLGSVGTAAYRSSIESSLPDNLPADAAAAASDSIDGAPTYADELPGALGQQLWRIVSSLVTNHAARQHVSPITWITSWNAGTRSGPLKRSLAGIPCGELRAGRAARGNQTPLDRAASVRFAFYLPEGRINSWPQTHVLVFS